MGNYRLLPILNFQVRHPSRNDHEVDRSIAQDLVGDVDVSDLGVARLRTHLVISFLQCEAPFRAN